VPFFLQGFLQMDVGLGGEKYLHDNSIVITKVVKLRQWAKAVADI
jgi:hypothetical protein